MNETYAYANLSVQDCDLVNEHSVSITPCCVCELPWWSHRGRQGGHEVRLSTFRHLPRALVPIRLLLFVIKHRSHAKITLTLFY